MVRGAEAEEAQGAAPEVRAGCAAAGVGGLLGAIALVACSVL